MKEDLNNEKTINETNELKFSKQKIAEKTDFIEQELTKVSLEKKNFEIYCVSLEKELAQAKEKIGKKKFLNNFAFFHIFTKFIHFYLF